MNNDKERPASYLDRIVGAYFSGVSAASAVFALTQLTLFNKTTPTTISMWAINSVGVGLLTFVLGWIFTSLFTIVPCIILGCLTVKFPISQSWFYVLAGIILGLLAVAFVGHGSPGEFFLANTSMPDKFTYSSIEFSSYGAVAGLCFWWKAGRYNFPTQHSGENLE